MRGAHWICECSSGSPQQTVHSHQLLYFPAFYHTTSLHWRKGQPGTVWGTFGTGTFPGFPPHVILINILPVMHPLLPFFSLSLSLSAPLSYLLTSWSIALLKKLTVSHLVKKFPPFYRNLSLSRARSTLFVSPHPTFWRSILILSSYYLSLILNKLESSLIFRLQCRINAIQKLRYFLLTLNLSHYHDAFIKPCDWSIRYAWVRADFVSGSFVVVDIMPFCVLYCSWKSDMCYILLVLVASRYISTEYGRPLTYAS
jgi:hypothetical protein